MAVRAAENIDALEAEHELSGAKKYRLEGGGRKTLVPEVRDALFGQFIDVRSVLKGIGCGIYCFLVFGFVSNFSWHSLLKNHPILHYIRNREKE